jgi:radical SAM protein with 4Fe4S-binding SPASM domain
MKFQCEKSHNHLHLYREGDVYLCCPGWIPNPVGNIFKTTLTSIWKGPEIRDIRRSIEEGTFEHCQACPHLPPPRGPIQILEISEVSGGEARIGLLMMGYDFTCNLRCPSCRPPEMRQSAKEDQSAKNITKRLIESGDLEQVNVLGLMGGGDPFASPLCRELLQAIPWQSCPNLKLSLFTNGLLFNQERWSALGEAREHVTEARISVDAASPTTYKLNRGGNWETLLENLRFVRKLRQSKHLKSLHYNFVVQSNNAAEMPNFVKLACSLGADRVYFQNLEQWGTYSKSDYLDRAIHLPIHPRHSDYLAMVGQANQELALLRPGHPPQLISTT